jgi:hypothetical protein
MKVSDILAHLRARLRDDNAEFTRIGDSLLINLIYYWQNSILSEFGLNIKEIKETLNEQDEVELPFEVLRVLAVYLDNQPITQSSYATSARHYNDGKLRFFEKRSQLWGFSKQVSGELLIFAVKKAVVRDSTDELILNDDFTNLLVFSVFLDVLKANISPDNAQQLSVYEQLIERERMRMIALQNRKNIKPDFTAPFVRV